MMCIISSMGPSITSLSLSSPCGIGCLGLTCLTRLRREKVVGLKHVPLKNSKMIDLSFFGGFMSSVLCLWVYWMDTFVLWRCSFIIRNRTELPFCLILSRTELAVGWSLRFVYIRYWVVVLLCFVLFCIAFVMIFVQPPFLLSYLFIYKIGLNKLSLSQNTQEFESSLSEYYPFQFHPIQTT